MKPLLVAIVLVALGGLACARVEPQGAEAAEPTGAPSPAASTAPVVLELFTSQGCSSCPAADRVLSKLGRDPQLAGRVVPLAFHVDYWNSIGWKDPFSAEEWTERQTAYSRPLGLDGGVYTPQLVVNGRAHLNGADEAGVLRLVEEAAAGAAGRVALAVDRAGPDRVGVEVTAEVPAAIETKKLEAVVVLFENGVTTTVARGENSGRTLTNDFIVRRLEKAFAVEPGASGRGRVAFELDPAWRRENLRVAAFLQDRSTMRIHGAAVE